MTPGVRGAIGLVLFVLGLSNIAQLAHWDNEQMVGGNIAELAFLVVGGTMAYLGFFAKKPEEPKPPPLPPPPLS
jgi:hypothetical protein